MNRAKASLIAVCLLASPGLAEVVDFTFAIWSDTHFGYWEGGGFRDNAAQDIINLPGTAYPPEIGGVVGPIEFIIHPGDITENSYYHQYEDDDAISDGDFIQCINRWFVPRGIPVYEITGNHDSWNEPGVTQIRAAIAARHGASSYSFDYHGLHFIGLDGGPDGTNAFNNSALDYLEAHMPTLTTEQAILIFNHYEGEEPGHAQWDRFYNAIEGYNVILHCVGHNHYPNVQTWRGFDEFVTSDCKVDHNNPGFSVVHVTDTRLTGIAYNWDTDRWYQRTYEPHDYVIIDKEVTGLGPWFSPEVVNPSFEDNGGSLDGWQITRADGKGPDNPPLSNSNPYGPQTPFGDHFAGKITCWQDMDFTFGQIIEVADFNPTSTEVWWSLSTHVQLYCQSGSVPFPDNVHQVWEIGWNDDGSAPANASQCDNYTTVATINGNYTGNDRFNFYPLSDVGSITGVTGLQYVAFRVRLYNDTAREWSMNNIDNVSFGAAVAPLGPLLKLNPTAIERSVWIGNNLPGGDVFIVTNVGLGTLNYAIEVNAGWLSVWPLSGSSSGEPDPIDVIYDVAGLLAGDHTATVTVRSAEALNSPQTITVTVTVETVGADFDGDSDVDLEDFGYLQRCYFGPGVPPPGPDCLDADLNGDGFVDLTDFGIFKRCLTGANIPADPGCAN